MPTIRPLTSTLISTFVFLVTSKDVALFWAVPPAPTTMTVRSGLEFSHFMSNCDCQVELQNQIRGGKVMWRPSEICLSLSNHIGPPNFIKY